MLSFLKTDFKIKVCLVWVCLVFLAADIGQAREKVQFKGIVTAYKLNIRTQPSEFSSVILAIEKGDQVDIIGEKGDIGDWLAVDFQGKKGYIRNRPSYLTLVPKEQASSETGTRPEPGSDSKIKQQQALATQIAQEEKKVGIFSKKEMEVVEGLNEIDYALNQARIKSQALAQETKELTGKIKKIQESRDILASQIDENQIYAGQRFNSLYRMRMIGRLDVAGAPTSMFDFFLTQNAMKQLIQSDLQLLEKQTQDLEKLSLLEEKLGRQAEAKTALETELDLQIQARERETQKKEALLTGIQQQKNLSLAALESLKASARDLDQKLNLLGKEPRILGEDASFSLQKGQLRFPVQGNIVSTFGPSQTGDYKSFTFQSGIDIQVERGEPVRAVFKGEVMYAQWLKGYGNLMIIDHGENYYTLYAHVQEVFKKKGERVGTGEVIATTGDSGSIKGLCLHFEVRHHGKPVNPMQWLKKGA